MPSTVAHGPLVPEARARAHRNREDFSTRRNPRLDQDPPTTCDGLPPPTVHFPAPPRVVQREVIVHITFSDMNRSNCGVKKPKAVKEEHEADGPIDRAKLHEGNHRCGEKSSRWYSPIANVAVVVASDLKGQGPNRTDTSWFLFCMRGFAFSAS